MGAHRVLGLTAERAFHVRKCPRCNVAPSESRGSGPSLTVLGTSMSGERSTAAMLMDHISRCPCSLCVIHLHDRIFHVLEEFMLEAGATKGLDLRLEVRRIRSGASRDRYWDVVWLDLMVPHRHLVVDVTVTSARTNIPMFLLYVLVSYSEAVLHWELNMTNLMRTSAFLLCLARLRFSVGP
jgi:hypothetical protein